MHLFKGDVYILIPISLNIIPEDKIHNKSGSHDL